MLLAADIGGTKIHLALYDGDRLQPNRAAPLLVTQSRYASADFNRFAPVLRRFLDEQGIQPGDVSAFCAGVAGPVIDEVARCPNLGWTVTCAEIREVLPVAQVELINDLVANGLGLAALRDDEQITLQPGGAPVPHGESLAALISAGTGLGMATLQPTGDGWLPWPSEGGHADFAPRGEEQIELLRCAQEAFGWPVSLDRLVSGSGLKMIYDYYARTHEVDKSTADQIRAAPEQASATISTAAMAATCPSCVRSLRLFVKLYAATAANLCLTVLAQGGLYIGGGIAPKILPAMIDQRFSAEFVGTGRHRQLLQSIPVHVVTNEDAALWGAARRARFLRS